MTTNLVVSKSTDNKALDKKYGHASKKAPRIKGRILAPGSRLEVLSKRGKRLRVRDDRGYEAEVSEDDVVLR